MVNKQQVMSNRDRYGERLKSKYPDKEFADDEALFGQINDDYDDYEERLGKYEEHEKALSDMFANNPRSAAFLTDWSNGGDPIVELIRKYGDEFKDALEDPEKQEALAEAHKEYAERIAKEKDFEEQYQANIQETAATIEALQEQEGIADEEIDDIMEFLVGIMKDAILGKFTAESILMARKAINHDSNVAEAEREGEILGRNAKIEEKLRKGSRNDGTADLNGRNGGKTAPQRKAGIFALAEEAM